MELNKIYNIDCLKGLKLLEDNSVDLTVTSPPYDDLRNYKGYSFDFENIAKELYRVTKTGGILVWIVGGATSKGSESGTSFRQALYFKECGFNLHDTMIYEKNSSAFPAARTSKRYTQIFEYMFVFSKGFPKTFNPIMRDCKLGGKLYDSTAKNMDGESGRHNLTYYVNKQMVDYNVWDIAVAQNKTTHPAVFPYEIPYRHIKTWTNEGDTVLDPFLGSGTTALAAIDLNRNYIGIELDEEYYNICVERIKEHART